MFNQQLFKRRLTNAPTGITQACCNCGLVLNSRERVSGSVLILKTLDNNPDAYLTQVIGGKTLCQFMF